MKFERWPNGQIKDPVFNKETLQVIARVKITKGIPTVRKTKKFKLAGSALKQAMEKAAATRRMRALKYVLGDENE